MTQVKTADRTFGVGTSGMWMCEPDETGEVYFVRRGDIPPEPEPVDWRARLGGLLRRIPGAGVVGAKRLDGEGKLFAMGDWVVHPKGFHHMGRGVDGSAYRFPEEVDTISGGVAAVRREVLEALAGSAGGVASEALGMLELGLTARREGWRVLAAPEVVVAETRSPLEDSAVDDEAFRRAWGFDWRAADLEEVRGHWGGTGLLWQARFHAEGMPFDKYEQRPGVHWRNYEQVEVYRQRADHLVKLAVELCPAEGRVVDLGCGDGLFTHLLARQNLTAIGIDPESSAIEQARQLVAGQTYSRSGPEFIVGTGQTLDGSSAICDLILMLDVIEHLPNPVAVLREAQRLLKPGGHVLISTPAWQYGAWSDPRYHVCEYTPEELMRQVQASGFAIHKTGRIGGVYRDIILVGRK